ncbi:MAG TPA: hypothetical protein VMW17_02885 [Candidatus Binatia bacterium]|nr:hypothetical protein [Candidatus Binatia bacterium]
MAKVVHDDRIQPGEQRLLEWGVGSDVDVDELRAHAHRDPAVDLAIAARLGARPGNSSVVLLREIDARSTDKLVHKEVKRALYRLQQRGVAIPSAPPAAAPAPLLGPQIEGYLSAVDGRGDQLIWLVRPLPGGIVHLLAVINDPEGLREVDLNQTTRKALRAARQELQTKHEIVLVEADWHYCDFLVNRAFRWAQARGGRIEGDYPGLRAQIVRSSSASDLPPLVLSKLDVATIRAQPALLAESAALAEEKEFRTWFFDPETLQPYLEAMLQAKDSPLVLSQTQQQDRFRVTVEHAVEELFGGDRQPSWVRRLYEMAYFFSATHRDLAARRACAVAAALEASTHGGRDIPLCEYLVRGSLAALLHAATEREQEHARSSLILTPQQAAAEAQRRRR